MFVSLRFDDLKLYGVHFHWKNCASYAITKLRRSVASNAVTAPAQRPSPTHCRLATLYIFQFSSRKHQLKVFSSPLFFIQLCLVPLQGLSIFCLPCICLERCVAPVAQSTFPPQITIFNGLSCKTRVSMCYCPCNEWFYSVFLDRQKLLPKSIARSEGYWKLLNGSKTSHPDRDNPRETAS